MASRLAYWFTELGIKQIFVCPDLNYSAAVHADKWIPILPNTDAAMHLAIAHTWLTESTYDQDYIDKQWNRHSFRNAINSTPIVGEHPEATVGKKSFRTLKPFDTVTLEEGQTMQDWLEVFVFPKLDLDTQDLIEKAIYWVNFWLGISNIARGDYSDVPQNTTLGGQEATLREASKLSKRWTRRIKVGYEEHIEKLLAICIATMDPEEVYTYLENDAAQSAWMIRDVPMGVLPDGNPMPTLAELKINVKLLVGREDGTQGLQRQQMALQLVERFFSYPPAMQISVRPIIKKSLFLLGYDDVDSLLPMPVLAPPVIDPLTGLPVAPAVGAPPVELRVVGLVRIPAVRVELGARVEQARGAAQDVACGVVDVFGIP
jgi:hypothetical protein